MKRFILQIMWFVIIILITLGVGEIMVRTVENPYSIKDTEMNRTDLPPIRTLVLGNSHLYFGIRPDLLPGRAMSLANVAQSLKYDLYLLQHYSNRLDSLNLLIFSVGYSSLYDRGFEDMGDWWRVIFYKLYHHLPQHSDFSIYGFELSHPPTYYEKLLRFMGIGDQGARCDTLGHGLSYRLSSRSPNWESDGARLAELIQSGLAPEMRKENIDVIDQIIDFAHSRNAKVVMVTTPQWHTFLDALPPGNYENVISTCDSIARANRIIYLNYTEDKKFGEDYFYDAGHLTSGEGAILLTNCVLNALDSLKTVRID